MKKRALTSCVPTQCIPAVYPCLCSHTTLLFSPSPSSSPPPSFSCVYNRSTLPRGQHCQPSHLQFSMQFVIRTSTCQTICTLHHLQLMLSFIAVKHSHVQQILGNLETTSCDSSEGSLLIEDIGFIRDEGVYSEDGPIDLDTFLLQLQALIARLRYTNPLMDLEIAWDIVNKNESVCILLGGTSGCGKSTLASLLAHR